MRLSIVVILLVLIVDYTYQAHISYNKSYCSSVDWSFPFLGFKIGCLLSEVKK